MVGAAAEHHCLGLTCPRRGAACSDTGCRPRGTTAGSARTAASSGSTSREDSAVALRRPLALLAPSVRGPAAIAPTPPRSLPPSLTPQGLHSSSSSAVCCSNAQRPSPALSVRRARTASWPAWPGHKDPSSGRLPSAEKQVESSERQERRRHHGRLPNKAQWGREVPLP